MKAKRLFLLAAVPLSLALSSAYTASVSDLYRIQFYVDPVIEGEPLCVHFVLEDTTDKEFHISDCWLWFYAKDAEGRLTEYGAYASSKDKAAPKTLEKGETYPLDLEFDLSDFPSSSSMQLDYSVNMVIGPRLFNPGCSYSISETLAHPPGLPYATEENPLVFRKNATYAPGRTSYDFAKVYTASQRTATTYRYEIYGLEEGEDQYLRPFHLRVEKICEETGANAPMYLENAELLLYGHKGVFGEMEDEEESTSSYSVFPLVGFEYAGVGRFYLGDGYALEKRTGVLRKDDGSASLAATKMIAMPVGLEGESPYYASLLRFTLDGDYVEIPLEDDNPNIGVGGTTHDVILWKERRQ